MTHSDADNVNADLPTPQTGDSQQPGRMMVPSDPLQPIMRGSWQSGMSSGPEILQNNFDPVWLLHSLRRRWILATGLGVLSAIAFGALRWWLNPPEARAVAVLRVSSVTPTIAFDVDAGSEEVKFDIYRQTQLSNVKSIFVIQAALRKEGIARLPILAQQKDPVIWLQQELEVEFPFNGENMVIALSAPTPDEAEQIVDAVKLAYMEEVVIKERKEKQIRFDQLQRVAQQTTEEIRDESEKFRDLAESLGAAQSDTASVNRELAFNQLSLLRKEQDDVREMVFNAEVALELLELAGKSIDPVAAAVSERMTTDPMAQGLNAQIQQVNYRIIEAKKRFKRPDHPRIQALEDEKQQVVDELSGMRNELYRSISAEMANGGGNLELESAMKGHRLRRKLYSQRLEQLEQDQRDLEARLQELAKNNVELEERQARLDGLRTVANTMQNKLESWKIELAAPPRVQIVQHAIASPGLTSLQRYLLTGMSGMFGLCVTCFGIAYWDFRHRRLNAPDQICDGLGIRVVGALPSLAFRKTSDDSDPVLAMLLESIDSVRTTLMHASTSKETRVVMVTSASGHEGRSTVASQLAASLARAGRRTLLVDGDLRHPSMHILFDFPLEDGLCEVLRAETDVADVVRPTHAEGLWLITAGYCNSEAIQALAKDQVQPIFEKLRADYDFIIIDAAPVLHVSDPLILGQYVDGAILSVMRDQSQVPKIHQASELLRSVGIRVIGSVVNGVQDKPNDRVSRLRLPLAAAAASTETASTETAADVPGGVDTSA